MGHIRRSGPGSQIPAVGGFEQHHRHGVDHRRRRSTELTASEVPTEWRNERLVAEHKRQPITIWLCALAKRISENHGGRRIAVIGMCLTGSLPVAMIAEDA